MRRKFSFFSLFHKDIYHLRTQPVTVCSTTHIDKCDVCTTVSESTGRWSSANAVSNTVTWSEIIRFAQSLCQNYIYCSVWQHCFCCVNIS
jgi:hypothetical protein